MRSYCPTCLRVFGQSSVACPEHGSSLKEDPLLATMVCGYEVTERLGDDLYACRHPLSQARLLCRLMPKEYSGSLTAEELLTELRKASAATAGTAVAPVDGALVGERFAYVFSPPSGARLCESLSQRALVAPLPLQEVLRIGIALCIAINQAHGIGFFHNLLRKESFLLADAGLGAGDNPLPRAYLLDLGPGRRLSREDRDLSDPRIDVFGIGGLLYLLATGEVAEPRATALSRATIPESFAAVILRALSPRPKDRFASVMTLGHELKDLLREERSSESLPPSAESKGGNKERSPLLPMLIAGATGVALAAAVLLIVRVPLLTPWLSKGSPSSNSSASTPAGAFATRDAAAVGKQGQTAEENAPQRRWGTEELVAPAVRARALLYLSEAQKSPDPVEREKAALIVGRSLDPRLLPLAEELLADVSPKVAGQAAWAIGQLGDRAAVVSLSRVSQDERLALPVGVALLKLEDRRGLEILRGVLRSKVESDRLESALWLGEHEEVEAWRVLRRQLSMAQDDNPLQHLFLLGRLCRGRDQAACQKLRERLTVKGGAGLRGKARLLLGAGLMQVGDPLGYGVLVEMAKDPELRMDALRFLAEASLAKEEEDALIAVLSGNPGATKESTLAEHRAEAAEILGLAASTKALPALQAALTDPAPGLRQAAAGAILRLSALSPKLLFLRAQDYAVASLGAQRSLTRAVAASVLGAGAAEPELAVPALSRMLSDRDQEVRLAAVHALDTLGSPSARSALIEAASDREGAVRTAALIALSRNESPEARTVLVDRLERGGLFESVVVAGALLARGERGHSFVLRQALDSPDVAVRRMAVEMARHHKEEDRRAFYMQALQDQAEEIRALAASGLALLGDGRGVETLRGAASLVLGQRLLCRDALVRLGEKVPSLDVVAVLGAAGEGQRASAMTVAAELQTDTALSILRRGLRDSSPVVRLMAIASVGELVKSQRARVQLLLLPMGDTDPALRIRAAVLLAKELSARKPT